MVKYKIERRMLIVIGKFLELMELALGVSAAKEV